MQALEIGLHWTVALCSGSLLSSALYVVGIKFSADHTFAQLYDLQTEATGLVNEKASSNPQRAEVKIWFVCNISIVCKSSLERNTWCSPLTIFLDSNNPTTVVDGKSNNNNSNPL